MNVRPRARLRAVAAASIVSLAAGSAVVLGGAAPAEAKSVSFDCTLPLIGVQNFSVDITTTAPADMVTGTSTTPDLDASMTIGAALADVLRQTLGATSFAGIIHSTMLVDGVEQVDDLTIPATDPGPLGQPMVVQASGALQQITAGDPGATIPVVAGPQYVAMVLTLPDQTTTPLDIPCAPSAGADTTVQTINVVKGHSETAATAKYSAKKDKATGTATVTTTDGLDVSGKVQFVLKRGSKKVGTQTVTLNASGKATASFTGVSKAGKYTLTASYRGSGLLGTSSDSAKFTVG